MTGPWQNNQQVYESYGIKPKTLANLADDGKIERRYIGRKPHFKTASIEAYFERQPQHLADKTA